MDLYDSVCAQILQGLHESIRFVTSFSAWSKGRVRRASRANGVQPTGNLQLAGPSKGRMPIISIMRMYVIPVQMP